MRQSEQRGGTGWTTPRERRLNSADPLAVTGLQWSSSVSAAKNIGEAFDDAAAPRLDVTLRQVETPTVFLSSGCDTAPAAPDDFSRLAESRYLRDLGVEVGSPDWAAVFGNPGAALPATAGLLPG